MKSTDIGATFQIPKFEAEVELMLIDSRYLKGRIFLPILTGNPLGHMPLADWLNEQSEFFPFLPDNSKEAEILSKKALVQAIIGAELDQNEIYEMMEQTVWIEQVEVLCSPSATLRGSILLNLPPGRSRVLDFLNMPTRFFALKNDATTHVINKNFVVSVRELPTLSVQEAAPVEKKRSSRPDKEAGNYRRGGKK
jgi:hypothetical protein